MGNALVVTFSGKASLAFDKYCLSQGKSVGGSMPLLSACLSTPTCSDSYYRYILLYSLSASAAIMM